MSKHNATFAVILFLVVALSIFSILTFSSNTVAKCDAYVFATAQSADAFGEETQAIAYQPYEAIYGDQVIIAVLDTGIDTEHKDLKGKVIKSVNFSQSKTEQDVEGHGTHVAGIITAGNESYIKLLNVKVADDKGNLWPSDLATGIKWAVDNGARIINMSLTTPGDLNCLSQAVEYARQHNVLLVAAAGNQVKYNTYPAAYSAVISVANMDQINSFLIDNQTAKKVDIYAPGLNVYSTVPGNGYAYKSGSSMATANVSRMAALKLRDAYCGDNLDLCNNIMTELLKSYPYR